MSEFGSRRALRLEEKALIRAMLLGHYPESTLDSLLEACQVEDMDDGGMGSVRFVNGQSHERHLGRVIRKASYVDADGVPVMISINLDRDDALFEVDFWKVDFSPLCRHPSADEIVIEHY
jgi:hypothetical protein